MLYGVITICFLTILLFFTAILFGVFYRERPIEKLKYFENEHLGEEDSKPNKKLSGSLLKVIAQVVPDIIMSQKRKELIEIDLIRAGLGLKAEELFVIKASSTIILSFLSYAINRDVFLFLLIILLTWNFPRLIIHRKKNQRLKLFEEQINEGIMIISNSLKAGYSFLQAVSVVAEETKDPFSKEFKKLLKEMSLGISMNDSLASMLNRVCSEDLKLIVNAILIQKDVGGNLSEILDTISGTIRERQKIQNELKTLTAQGKLSGTIVVLIPVFLGFIIYFFNKEYMLLLLTTKIGIGMLASAVMSQLIGILLINKIIKINI